MKIYKNLNTLSINIFSVFIWKIFLSGFGSVREKECGSGSTVLVSVPAAAAGARETWISPPPDHLLLLQFHQLRETLTCPSNKNVFVGKRNYCIMSRHISSLSIVCFWQQNIASCLLFPSWCFQLPRVEDQDQWLGSGSDPGFLQKIIIRKLNKRI